jgi:glutamate synthase domain-containing protein 2
LRAYELIDRLLPARYRCWAACILLTAASLAALPHSSLWLWPAAIGGVLSLIGLVDYLQPHQAIRRNYPVIAHFRFFFEYIRPEIRQYFVESESEELPFSRTQRSIVYQRAKQAADKHPFGTLLDVYETDYEWINHSIAPTTIDSHDFRITIGGPECRQPYSASVFNVSAMSFGALSANAILALNEGARRSHCFHDTGEGSISRYHRQPGGDLVWEIGSGYFGCRDAAGRFNPQRFVENACLEQVKMIEIKLSQGAKPGHGGVLPGAKVTAEIAAARGVSPGQDCISPASHSAFSTPRELIAFINQLRELSGGKPVGIKLSIGHPWEWFAIVKAMIACQSTPDFIVVDGGEGGTGAAPLEFTDHVGTPLRDALILVHNTLVATHLRDRIRIGASGKIVTAFDMARTLAIGADWCNAARGFMFSLGCLQARTCHTGHCPAGVTTQDPHRMRALDVEDKAARVHNYHQNTLKALKELLCAAGLNHTDELGPEHIIRRVSETEVHSLAALHRWCEPGELLDPARATEHSVLQAFWTAASPDTFTTPSAMQALRHSKNR